MDLRRRLGTNQLQIKNRGQSSISLDLKPFTMPFLLTLKSKT